MSPMHTEERTKKISKRLRQSLGIIASQCIWGAITYTYTIAVSLTNQIVTAND